MAIWFDRDAHYAAALKHSETHRGACRREQAATRKESSGRLESSAPAREDRQRR